MGVAHALLPELIFDEHFDSAQVLLACSSQSVHSVLRLGGGTSSSAGDERSAEESRTHLIFDVSVSAGGEQNRRGFLAAPAQSGDEGRRAVRVADIERASRVLENLHDRVDRAGARREDKRGVAFVE
jgi:hypothetical protein